MTTTDSSAGTDPYRAGSVRTLPTFRPADAAVFQAILDEEWGRAVERTTAHEHLAWRWETIAKWSSLIVTVSAGISTLTILADKLAVATAAAIVAVVISGLNSSFDPPRSAKENRQAARRYARLLRPLEDYSATLHAATIENASTHEIEFRNGEAEADKLWDAFDQCRREIEDIMEVEPAVNLYYWHRYEEREAEDMARPRLGKRWHSFVRRTRRRLTSSSRAKKATHS